MSEFDRLKAQKDEILAKQEEKRWSGWLPTAANVNALPEPVRKYVHDLETRCDPSGDTRELAVAKDIIRAQELRIQELESWKVYGKQREAGDIS